MDSVGTSEKKSAKELIFVVDDEPMVAEVVEAILSMEGYDIRMFADPKLALKTLGETGQKPDLLLTDFRMPGMTGMELIEQSKAMLPQLKTILFSGYVDEKFLASTQARPDMFMRKPFYPQTLVDLVTDVLKNRPRA